MSLECIRIFADSEGQSHFGTASIDLGDGTVVASGGYIVDIQADGNGETLHKMRRKVGVVR